MAGAYFTRRDALRSFVVQGPVVTMAALAGAALAWQIVAIQIERPWLPPFTDAFARLVDLFSSGEIQPVIASSATNLVVGYAIAVVLGVSLGALMALSRNADYAFRALVDGMLFVPAVVYAPLVLAFMGLSELTLIIVVVLFAVFNITVNTQTAITGVDTELREMAFSFGASRKQLLREIIFPAAMPQILDGLRLGMARAVKGMIIGELFVTVVGLGALERRYSFSFDAVGVWSITLIVIGLAVVCLWAIQIVDRAINWWAH